MSSSKYKINPKVLVGVPTLELRPLSWEWTDAYYGMAFPLGAQQTRLRIHGQDVAAARNAIVEAALQYEADYILFIGDDNLPPANLFELLHRHKENLVTGVYWSKGYPSQPYLWDGLLKGHYTDWKLGEYFQVDFAGCDALLAHTDVFKAMAPPWFTRDATFEPGQPVSSIMTEDFPFYTKARAAGFKLFCDTEAQVGHQDRPSGVIFGVDRGMPQLDPKAPPPSQDPELLVADIGAGYSSPWFGANAKITRFDHDPKTNPDVRCDVRCIPQPDCMYDIVTNRHCLEHFMWNEAPTLINEWCRILKVGGTLRINVPNVAYAAREILRADEDESYSPGLYPLWQLYGKQEGNHGEVHRTGFTRRGLKSLLEACGLGEVSVEIEGDFGENLDASGIKQSHPEPLAMGPIWRDIEAKEQPASNGNGQVAPRNGHAELEPIGQDEPLAVPVLEGV